MRTTEQIFRSLTNCTDSLLTFQKAMDVSDKVAKIYAQQVAEDVRQRCYDNSLTFDDKGILETEIILP